MLVTATKLQLHLHRDGKEEGRPQSLPSLDIQRFLLDLYREPTLFPPPPQKNNNNPQINHPPSSITYKQQGQNAIYIFQWVSILFIRISGQVMRYIKPSPPRPRPLPLLYSQSLILMYKQAAKPLPSPANEVAKLAKGTRIT